MIVEDQSGTIHLLSDPATFGAEPVERIDTHSAVVFLAGARAFKLKRAVRFDYLDFSSSELRRAACEAEVAINRRSAPTLYRGVVPIARDSDGRLAMGGPGQAVDWVIEMVRFDQELLLDRMAARGALPRHLMPELGRAIARFHAGAEPHPDEGGEAGMRWVIDGNAEGFADQGAGMLDADACRRLTDDSRAMIDRRQGLLEDRRANSLVRWCHGDLHLRNIVLLDGVPTLFDAIEFNAKIACTDVLYDIAFLLMDLWRRHLPAHANDVFNAYLDLTGDRAGLALMPLFLSCRAAVRAKTSASTARVQEARERRDEAAAAAARYLTMARELLDAPAPQLVAIGGLSGSGKTTLAMQLAPRVLPVPGALIMRTDVERKNLFGVAATTRLGPEAYTAAVSAMVYARLFDRAVEVLQAGHSVVMDAVFADEIQRTAAEETARRAGVVFHGLWLEAPPPLMLERLTKRVGDASDATPAVLHEQLSHDAHAVAWQHIDASGSPEEIVRRGAKALFKETS